MSTNELHALLSPDSTEFETVAARPQPAPLPLAADSDFDPVSPTALSRLALASNVLSGDVRTLKLRRAIDALRDENGQLASDLAVEVLQEDENSVLAWRVVATAQEKLGDYTVALFALEQVYKRNPEQEGIEGELGRIAFLLGSFEQAEQLVRLHLAREPDDFDAINNLACALRDQMRLSEAVDLLRRALTEQPQHALLWNSLATIMSAMGDAANALVFFDEAIRLDPKFAKAVYNRGNLKLLMGDIPGAIEDGRAALTLATGGSDQAMMKLALSLAELSDGRLEEGWARYEVRFDPLFHDLTLFAINRPLWTPQDSLAGASILLVGEQGLGDEIMFASMLPDICDEVGAAGQVYLAVDARLVPLFQRSFPEVRVGAYATGKLGHRAVRVAPFAEPDLHRIDYMTPLGGLLRRFRNRIEGFPDRVGFLTPDPERVEHWRRVLGALDHRPKVGLLWKSLVIDPARARYFSSFERWGPVLALQDQVTFVNLQYGDCSRELAEAAAAGISLWSPPGIDLKEDLDDLAALTSALDLVIGPANATSNIAAASGAQVWLLSLPKAWPQLGTSGWPWYPQLRVFESEGCGLWSGAIQAMADAIRARFTA